MIVRTLPQLKRVQSELLAEIKKSTLVEELQSTDTMTEAISDWIGRIDSVVSSDPDHGPHLVVLRRAFSGAPPTTSDMDEREHICYPTPGRSVNDYAVDEEVVLLRVRGALLAGKLP